MNMEAARTYDTHQKQRRAEYRALKKGRARCTACGHLISLTTGRCWACGRIGA